MLGDLAGDDPFAAVPAAVRSRITGIVHAAALTDLVSDSYRLVEMAIELQEDYDVVFTQADLSAVTTVGDLTRLVLDRLP